MGLSRDSFHKRRKTGGKRTPIRVKRKYELARPPSLTRIGAKRIHEVRSRGGNIKLRGLRLDQGTFSWGTQGISHKTRLLNVVYNASNNELVRTNTLVKGCIVQIDAAPFRAWYKKHYGLEIGKKKKDEGGAAAATPAATEEGSAAPAAGTPAVPEKISRKVQRKQSKRTLKAPTVEQTLKDEFNTGRLLACLSSRPGQSGRADGYILEGPELAFYQRKLKKK